MHKRVTMSGWHSPGPLQSRSWAKKMEVSELVLTLPLNVGVFWLRAGDKVVRCTKYECETEKDFV